MYINKYIIDDKTAEPTVETAKNISISKAPHKGSTNLPHSTATKIPRITNQRCTSKNACVTSVHIRKLGGNMRPGVTASPVNIRSVSTRNVRRYIRVVEMQIAFTTTLLLVKASCSWRRPDGRPAVAVAMLNKLELQMWLDVTSSIL